MKKLIVFIFGVILMSVLNVEAKLYNIPSDQIWRTTSPSNGWNFFSVATGTIILWDVNVASGGAGSNFRYFDSTATSVITSTSAYYDTSVTNYKHPIRRVLKNGFMFSSTGTAVLDIDWDWFNGPLPGQDSKGR